jgi:transposase InsO family protein
LLASKLRNWKGALLIVQPDTVLRWHRDLFRLVWRHKSQPKQQGGRRPLPGRVVQLIRRLACENPLWGAERIGGEMLKQNMGVAKSSVQKYTQDLRRVGPSGQSWGTFLRNHASEIWACDFLQTYDALFHSIFVFVIIELESRRVVHVNVTRHPTDAWVAQQLREATPFGEGPRFLIRDNDKKYGGQFQGVVNGADIDILNTPVEAPRANAFCERFLGSLRRECLDSMLILSERHLRRIVSEYVTYFNEGMRSGGRMGEHLRLVSGQERRGRLTGPVSDEGIAQKVKDRALLLATGFNYGQDAFNKAAAALRLGTMGAMPPDNRVTQRAFGTIVGRLKAGYGYESPQIRISSQQATARLSGPRRRNLQPNG